MRTEHSTVDERITQNTHDRPTSVLRRGGVAASEARMDQIFTCRVRLSNRKLVTESFVLHSVLEDRGREQLHWNACVEN